MSKNKSYEKSSSEAADSPIQRIKQKEMEFSGKYLEAKKQAEFIISDARKKASEIKVESKESSVKEAEEYYKINLAALNRDKAKIDDKEVIKVKSTAEKNFKKAYDFLIDQIIPTL